MKTGTCQTVVIKSTRYQIEKVKGYFSRQVYYKVWRMHDFPRHDDYKGTFDTIAQFRQWAKAQR